jgi:broad specificity phosphatase PhoE
MVEIILVRHGETAWNASETFRGRKDVPLNDTGVRQAQLLGEYLRDEKIDIIYSSSLQRAVKTAEAIAAPRGLTVNIVKNLDDMDFGEWEGLTLDEVKDRYEEVYRDWLDTPEQVKIPGGETLADVENRVAPFLQEAVARLGEGKLVLVSHRVVHKVLICALLCLGNAGFFSIKMDNAAVTRFTFDGDRAILTCHNDTSFLKPLNRPTLNDF